MLSGQRELRLLLSLLLLAGQGDIAFSQDLSWWITPEQRREQKRQEFVPVDVNRATSSELQKVPGMTKVWAGRIVRYRPYSNKAALKLEGVIPGQVYERMKPYLVAHREK